MGPSARFRVVACGLAWNVRPERKGARKQQNNRKKECKLLRLRLYYSHGLCLWERGQDSPLLHFELCSLYVSSFRTINMVRPHATPSQPRSARPSTTKLVESASQAKERTTSTRKRGATEDLLNPNKKSSKSKKTDS